MTTFTLEQLAVLFGGERSFRKNLQPFHEVRPEGIFVMADWHDEGFRETEHRLSGAELCPPGIGGITGAVLPPEFTEEQLLAFLAIRTDMAWELERRYTNDKPKPGQTKEQPDADTPDGNQSQPLDDNALRELATLLPNFAVLLRRRLPTGSRWHVADESPGDEKAPDSVQPVPQSDEAPPLEDWKMRVHAEAAAHWLRLRKLNCNPTKHTILPHMAKWCRENDIRTTGRINPSEGYLRTHVLRKWEPPR